MRVVLMLVSVGWVLSAWFPAPPSVRTAGNALIGAAADGAKAVASLVAARLKDYRARSR